jgi:DNA-binding MarR family transcriptional regulator
VAWGTDRRVTLLELTAAGAAAAEDALAPRLAQMGELFDRLSPDERNDLERMPHTLVGAIDRIEDDVAPSPG